jgi:SNF2 family DNA or RNA helicase
MVAKELPQKIVIDVFCELSPIQRQLYDNFQLEKSITDEQLEAQYRNEGALFLSVENCF